MSASSLRLALLSSVSTAMAVCLLPTSAEAQATTCSQSGATINCVDGGAAVLTATASPGTATVAGPGLSTINTTVPSTITYTDFGPIATTGVRAVDLTSTGGDLNVGPAASAPAVDIRTVGGNGAIGLTLNTAGRAATVTVGNISTSGANSTGVLSTSGADLTLRTGNITTTGGTSTAIDASAQTGSIAIEAGTISSTGRGIHAMASDSGTNTIVVGNVIAGDPAILANGGTVSVVTGTVTTSTNGGSTLGGYGVLAQAFTGDSTVRTGAINTVNGSGIIALTLNPTGSVNVAGCPTVTTTGNNATAIVAQATGAGSVTINCGALTTSGANSDGAFATSIGGNVVATVTSVTTSGVGSFGLTAITSGTGTVTTNGGVITTTGVGSNGLFVRAEFGTIDAGYGNITTSGIGAGVDTARALDLVSTGAITLRGSSATLRTNGAGVTAALLLGAGVTGNLGDVVTTGSGAQGATITSTAPVNLTIGNVATTGNALTVSAGTSAVTLATGTVTATEAGATGTVINAAGPIIFTGGRQTANGANALRIEGGAGAIAINVAGAATTGTANAVNITGTGPLGFTNSATITMAGANSVGLNIGGVTRANVNCGNVSTTGANSPAVVISANGTTNVTCGTVTTTGVASDAILMSNIAGTATVTGGTTSATGAGSRGIVVTSSAPAATGLVTVNTGAVTAHGNAVVALSTGSANVVVNATGNVSSTTGTGITATTAGISQITIGAGTTTTGVQGVNLQGIAGNTLIVSGTLRNIGSTTTPYTVRAGGPFALTLGASGSIVGPLAFTTDNDTFNNQGTFAAPTLVDLGAGNDVFNNSGTLTAFTGTSTIANLETFNNVGGLIEMRDGAANDVLAISGNFVGSGASRLGIDYSDTTSDRLVINGAASGTTTVNVTNLGAGLLNVPGVMVVDNATSSPGSFVLGAVGGNTSQLVDYSLAQVGPDYFLVSTPNATAFDPVAFTSLAPSLWYQSADEVFLQTDQPAATVGTSFWGQVYHSRDKFGDSNDSVTIGGTSFDVNNRLETNRMGIQGGVDYGFPGASVGLTGGYGRAKADNDLSNDFKANGWNIGLYGQFGGLTGLHGSGLIKYDRYKLRFDRGVFDGERSRLTALGIDGSLGYRFGLGYTATMDAKVGISRVRTKLNDVNAFGFNYDIGRITSTRGRAGVRATFGGTFAPYVDAMVYREFSGRRNVALFDDLNTYDIGSTNGKATWARLEAGISSNGGAGPLVAAWADLGDKKGFGLRAGFRFGGAAVAEVIAQPAPVMVELVAPPPATQICPDGLVSLATDACPVLLPPPPPAPEAQAERE